jgi:two-component system, NtrC family, response regulator AtoC
MKKLILVIDDDPEMLELVTIALQTNDYDVKPFNDPRSGLEFFSADSPDLVLTDLQMPGLSGIEVLQQIKVQSSETPVILMTALGTIRSAVEAIKSGAFDFLTKPLDVEHLLNVINRAIDYQDILRENSELRAEVADLRGSRIAPEGASSAMRKVLEIARAVAPTSETVLITGESGTGKEVLADIIQRGSDRKDAPYIKVNCAALTGSLLESELFGHEKGAFTGALARRIGRFELAHKGTIFLDEIGDMPLEAQTRLLRVLQQRELQRVGGTQNIQLDIRVVCATNKNLKDMVAEGKFREDLYYRINVIDLHLPPLRHRKSDIPALAMDLLQGIRKRLGRGPSRISPDAMELLCGYNWPGNIRELENVMARCAILCEDAMIETKNIPDGLRSESAPKAGSLAETRGDSEKTRIIDILDSCEWNMSKAAQLLGVGRSTLYSKMAQHGIRRG